MINNVIFDVDGTLINSVDFHAEAWQRSFEKFGKTVDLKAVRDQIGKGGDQLMPVFLSQSEIDEFGEQLEKHRGELFKTEYLPRVQPFADARLLIAKAIADGKQVVLASSANPEEIEHFKKLLHIDHLIDDVNAEDIEESKPEPDVFIAAMKKLGNPPLEETVVVGDSPYDAIAASKIGLQTIGILCGGFDEAWLREAGCVEIYENPTDLLNRCDESMLMCKPK